MVGHGTRSAEGAGLLRGAGVPWLVDVPHDAEGGAKNRSAETIQGGPRATDPAGRLHRDSERFRYQRERCRIVTLIASGAVLVPLQLRIIASSQQQPDAIEAIRRYASADISGSAVTVASLTVPFRSPEPE
jgi:hypothetical protein